MTDGVLGCLIGLAVGDALGTTLEFQTPGSFAPLAEMVGGGPFDLKPGQWTDDTSMALCLAASLVETGTFDLVDQLERYSRWRRAGYMSSNGVCFDVGLTVTIALNRFRDTGDPYSGPTDADRAGNGSIMRLAPVPMRYFRQPAEAVEKSAESSRTTHGAQTAVDGCRYLGALIVGALTGARKQELLADHFAPCPDFWRSNPLTPEIDEIAKGSFRRRQPPEIRGGGYVVESLEAALWSFHRSESFEHGCLLAVNLGGDADTTGAVYGQLAGAFYGINGIPARWMGKLAHLDLIYDLARKLQRQALGA